MQKETDIVASAPPEEPETLADGDLDGLSAGAYGGSNSCEPYAGDNTCEQPSGGHASFEDLQIKRDPKKTTRTRGFTAE